MQTQSKGIEKHMLHQFNCQFHYISKCFSALMEILKDDFTILYNEVQEVS